MADIEQGATGESAVKHTHPNPEEKSQDDVPADSIAGSIVAKHYNDRQDIGLRERTKSCIFFMRNFNNWIKSICIADALQRLRESDPHVKLTVLDLCCGKGGDLLKWKKGQISRLVCSDIAEVSLKQCEERYRDLGNRSRGNPHEQVTFSAEFHRADLSKELLSEKYDDPNIQFDLSSCQFSFHYSFESYSGAETMLRNACERLRPGGYFIATVPDACELVRRLRASNGMHFGNDVYSVTFHTDSKDYFPLFGCRYDFHLEGVVDCPEFLLYFPLLENMAKKYDMKLVYRKTFHEFFNEHVRDRENERLLSRMTALEQYPPDRETPANSQTEGDYAHAWNYIRHSRETTDQYIKLGTLSKSEWEATCLYLVCAFVKESPATQQSTATSVPS